MRNKIMHVALLAVAFVMIVSACGPTPTAAPAPATQAPAMTEAPAATEAPAMTEAPAAEEFIFGILMVGPYNDHGWSQAHYEAGLYVEQMIPGTKMIYIDKVNPADRPGTTPAQLAEELVSQGAKLIIFNSDDMKDSSTEFAQAHPDIFVIMASGDQVWQDGKDYTAMPNMTNIMGKMVMAR